MGELQEDVAAKVEVIKANVAAELELLPQGDKVPQDAEDYKIELKRIQDFVADLQKRVMKECDNFSEDVKYWAEYKTGIKEFKPWLENAEVRSKEGLGKPQTLDEANAMFANVNDFDKACVKHLNILDNANAAAQKMTTHKEADVEVLALGKGTLPSRLLLMNGARRLTPWLRNGSFWMTLSTTLTPGLPRTTDQRANSSSLLRRWSPPLESSRTSSRRKRSWWITCKLNLQNQPRDSFRIAM